MAIVVAAVVRAGSDSDRLVPDMDRNSARFLCIVFIYGHNHVESHE